VLFKYNTIMKNIFKTLIATVSIIVVSCNSQPSNNSTSANEQNEEKLTGQSGVQDNVSNPNVVQIASGSKDHSTLVAAVKAANLVDVLSNTGPFTVFAPTNAAFDKLPAGTVESLLKPEKLDALTDILQYHVYVGVIKAESLQDGQILGEVNGGNISITMKNGQPLINGKAHILASIPASNGIIHVIDEVLIPGK
jgi:uncharacterized surface protein with fasciclin (FAS1) repeats